MDARQYRLNLNDGGPGDIDELILSDGGVVQGPDLPNWQPSYLLGICKTPTSYSGEALHYVTLAPRYVGESFDHIRQSGGVVGVGRVLPGRDPSTSRVFHATDIEYWAVGILSILTPQDPAVNIRATSFRRYYPGFALTLNVLALFVYAFACIGPLLPSHGLPSLWILLAFVGGPSVLIFVASRLCQSLEARVFCYFEITFVVGLSLYMYLKLAQIIGSQHIN